MRRETAMAKKSRKLRDYFVDGEARNQEWIISNREMVEAYTRDEMKEHGFVPVVGEDSKLTWQYDQDKDTFRYRIAIKALWVGKVKAKDYFGVVDGVLLDSKMEQAELV